LHERADPVLDANQALGSKYGDLALGIAASLAVNVAQGWSHGLVEAVVAAWHAASLAGSYELLASCRPPVARDCRNDAARTPQE
jgi:hypothetical protein